MSINFNRTGSRRFEIHRKTEVVVGFFSKHSSIKFVNIYSTIFLHSVN